MLKPIPLLILLMFTIAIGARAQDESKFTQQSIYNSEMPDGIYHSMNYFVNKVPSSTDPIFAKNVFGKKQVLEVPEHNSFFFYKGSNKKVTNVFAVVVDGQIFFQIKSILKHRNKKDKNQTNSTLQSFVRVLLGGDNYYFTEVDLANQWSQALNYNLGVVGGVTAQDASKGKGVVWDINNREFNIFRNCKDFNEFLTENLGSTPITCQDKQPDGYVVRERINEVK